MKHAQFQSRLRERHKGCDGELTYLGATERKFEVGSDFRHEFKCQLCGKTSERFTSLKEWL